MLARPPKPSGPYQLAVPQYSADHRASRADDADQEMTLKISRPKTAQRLYRTVLVSVAMR